MLSGVIEKFFSGEFALSCGAPHRSYAILECIRNGRCCPRSLVSRVGNLLAGLFKH